MERLYVLPQDVCNITGKKLRYAQNLLKNLKILLGKKKHQYISKTELSIYLNVDEALITLGDLGPASKRICVYPEDVRQFTDKHLRTAQVLILNLRLALKKQNHHLVTIRELADYLNVDESLIKAAVIRTDSSKL